MKISVLVLVTFYFVSKILVCSREQTDSAEVNQASYLYQYSLLV